MCLYVILILDGMILVWTSKLIFAGVSFLAAIIPPKIILFLLTKAVLVTLSIAIRRSLEEKRIVKIVLTHFKIDEVVF